MANIIIVDDDPAMLTFLQSALENAGHTTTHSDNGLDALETIKEKNNFDLLLTDIIMPGMDGIELVHAARRVCPTMKYMFMTGFSAVALGDKNPEKEDSKILSKPFHLNDLLAQIEEMLAAEAPKPKNT